MNKRFLFILLAVVFLFVPVSGCSNSALQVQADINQKKPLSVTDLCTDPPSPQPDETFTFNLTVTNSGDVQAEYNAVLRIIELEGKNESEVVKLTENIAVAAGGSELLIFNEMHLPEGIYKAVIDNLTSIFKVSCS